MATLCTRDGRAGSTQQSAAVNAAADATTAIVAAQGAGTQIWVYGYELGVTPGGTYLWKSAATAKQAAVPRGANGGAVRDSGGHRTRPLFKCGTNEALNLTTVTAAVTGDVSYRVVNV